MKFRIINEPTWCENHRTMGHFRKNSWFSLMVCSSLLIMWPSPVRKSPKIETDEYSIYSQIGNSRFFNATVIVYGIYICVYIYIYICIHMYVCMSVCMYVCMSVCMDVCMSVCMDVCMSVCMDVCMYACLYGCMYVCLSVWMYVCLSVCMDVCMYVCMDVCMYVRLYGCMYVCLYGCMYVCLSVWMYVCMSVWMYVCMSVWMYVCLSVWMYVWMYVCMSVWMYVCLSVWMYVCMSVCMDVCMSVCMDVCMYVCLYGCMYVCLYGCMYVCLSVWMYVCMSVCMDVCMYVCLYGCIYIYIYIGAYIIHIHTHTFALSRQQSVSQLLPEVGWQWGAGCAPAQASRAPEKLTRPVLVKENESHHPNITPHKWSQLCGNSWKFPTKPWFRFGAVEYYGEGILTLRNWKTWLSGPSSWVETNTLPPMCPPRPGHILRNKSTFSMGQSCRNMDRTGDRIYNEYMRMPWL